MKLPSFFRDPSGFLFLRDGIVFRQINSIYKENYEHLMETGLYRTLVDNGLLVKHSEVNITPEISETAYKIVQPEQIPFISYPFEWCFSQLKDAALATLKVQKLAFNFGMVLKDCSAYNIQFMMGKPIFIDTLSFEKYHEGQPWVAYRQFCRHFLVPLALMSYKDARFSQLLKIYIDGIPLDLAIKSLPFSAYLKPSLLLHIYTHAKTEKYFSDKGVNIRGYKMSRLSLLGLIDGLELIIKNLKWKPKGTEWLNYYNDNSYSPDSFLHKEEVVSKFLDMVNPKVVWDLGANVGIFSRIAGSKGINTISFDNDPSCVEKNYLRCRQESKSNILPVLMDLTNPSPAIGWQNQERMSLLERGPVDMVFALAIIHHLSISNNISFNSISQFFSKICNFLIIEFIPKNDEQVRRLLATRQDIFYSYNKQVFEREFAEYFTTKDFVKIKSSERTLYLMQKKEI